MPITKNLVTLMGGIISVKSQVDKGSTFIVELILRRPQRGGQTAGPETACFGIPEGAYFR